MARFELRTTSRFDGRPIRVVLITSSKNRKTRNVASLWILPCEDPRRAAKGGRTRCICGDCRWQRCNGGGCYVNVAEAPLQLWRWRHTARPWDWTAIEAALARKKIKVLRLGAYGDPAAPRGLVICFLVQIARSLGFAVVGYTHASAVAPDLQGCCMASCDSAEQARALRAQGWRTFRTLTAADPAPVKGEEIMCPSMRGAHCDTCCFCNGLRPERPNAASVCILPHGNGARRIWNVKE